MKLIYTHPTLILVENAKNLLENALIKTQIRNEFAIGGMGELAPINVWPELWIKNDKDETEARRLLDEMLDEPEGDDWVCKQCGETNSPAFYSCWQCQTQAESE